MPSAKKSTTPQEFKKFLSDEDIITAKILLDSNALSKEQVAAKFSVHPATIYNRVAALTKETEKNYNPIYSKELCNAVNLLIILNKRLVTQLAQVDFSKFTTFKDITVALKTISSILTPLHAAYRAESQKSGNTLINLTHIIEKNFENEEVKRQKIIDVLRKSSNSKKK